MTEKLEDYLEVLNETGFFFQMRVAKETRDVFSNVNEEVAFEFHGLSAKLDVLVESSCVGFRVFVFIEAKRHLHDYKSWIFFKP